MSRVVVNEIEAKVGNDISFNDAAKIDTLKGKTTAGSISVQGEGSNTTNLQQGLAKAWANFDEQDPNQIRDNLNVASLTDNGTGYFSVNLTNAMNNNDYSRVGSAGENSNSGGNRVVGLRSPSTGSFNLFTCNTGGSASDTPDTCVAIFGDLA
tara:strand:- start:3109 stop:3567 length:459 start_codon:yes stop_codon:yes gene_type:complete